MPPQTHAVRRTPPGRTWLGGLALPALSACSQPSVQAQVYQGGPVARPDRVVVHEFAVRPEEVRLDSGLRGRLTQAFSGQGTTARQEQAARETAAAVTQALADELRTTGFPVERVAGGAATPGRGRALVVEGQVLGVDEGNRTRRTLVGLGAGMSSVEVAAQVHVAEDGAPPRPLESFTARADSGRMPGMAETMGAGAAAGRLATTAAVGGLGQAAVEGSRADDVGEARRLGRALGQRIRQYFAQQGWATAR